MIDYAYLLGVAYAGAEWSMVDNDPSTLVWHSEGEPPSQAELDAAWPAVRDARGWAAVRAERDALLTACDWTQVADAPLSSADKQAWADYRQALRDVPQDFDLPDDVVWPEAP